MPEGKIGEPFVMLATYVYLFNEGRDCRRRQTDDNVVVLISNLLLMIEGNNIEKSPK